MSFPLNRPCWSPFAQLLDLPFGRHEVTINIASAAALHKKLITATEGYVGAVPTAFTPPGIRRFIVTGLLASNIGVSITSRSVLSYFEGELKNTFGH
ncbi:MAG: hypothetical protein NTW28_02170 [Candidatus Solibacter sp.]|nr:hypothetical protein [Candidatus Solibacter sp.]